MITHIHNHPQYHEKLQDHWNAVYHAELLHTLILAAFRLALAMACLLVEEVLNQRSCEFGERRCCPQCGALLESRGLVERTLMSLLRSHHMEMPCMAVSTGVLPGAHRSVRRDVRDSTAPTNLRDGKRVRASVTKR